MPLSWRWRLVVALLGIALMSPSGAAAKIERFKDKEGTLHISNTGEVPVKPGGATAPNQPSTPTATPAPPPQPIPPLPRPVPVPPPPEQVAPQPPADSGEAPPVMDRDPNEQQLEPPAEQPAPEAGNNEAGHQAQIDPGAAGGQPKAPPTFPQRGGHSGRGGDALGKQISPGPGDRGQPGRP
jgi:outer membrane biosynthesis protein TonB